MCDESDYVKGLRKTMENISHNNRCPSRISNQVPPVYEPWVFPLRSVIVRETRIRILLPWKPHTHRDFESCILLSMQMSFLTESSLKETVIFVPSTESDMSLYQNATDTIQKQSI
jgi:hypothetical protein